MKQPSLIFRIERVFYFLRLGLGKLETEHYIFDIPVINPPEVAAYMLYCRLADHGFQPNHIGYSYKRQIYQARKLDKEGRFQYHLRAYSDGSITAHYETAPEYDASDHLKGVGLRDLTPDEIEALRIVLTFEVERL